MVGERNATVGQGLTFHCGRSNGLSAAEVAKIYEQEMPAGMVRKSSKWIYCSNSPTGDNLGGHTSSWYTIFETSLRIVRMLREIELAPIDKTYRKQRFQRNRRRL